VKWEEETRPEDSNDWRLLLLDGHNSHYTARFLRHAVYQGLDVVVFSVFKRIWEDICRKDSRLGMGKISKNRFLKPFSDAFLRAFTESNIKSAFESTGVLPFNPDFIRTEQMAPAMETSLKHTSIPVKDHPAVEGIISILSRKPMGSSQALNLGSGQEAGQGNIDPRVLEESNRLRSNRLTPSPNSYSHRPSNLLHGSTDS